MAWKDFPIKNVLLSFILLRSNNDEKGDWIMFGVSLLCYHQHAFISIRTSLCITCGVYNTFKNSSNNDIFIWNLSFNEKYHTLYSLHAEATNDYKITKTSKNQLWKS